MQTRRARLADLDSLAPLFDAYRVFYERASDPSAARAFLEQRLQRDESVVFVAEESAGSAVGFAQIFPSFSSVSLARILVLNDLFVDPGARRRGVARALLVATCEQARACGAVRVSLATAVSNAPARRLYEAFGFEFDKAFDHYHWYPRPS